MVTLALSGNTSAVLSGNTTVKAINGLATFAGLSVNQTGTYSLTANSTPVYTAATSNLFSINGPTAKLAFFTQPGGAAVGAALNPQPVVAIQDANGNLVSSDNSTMVTLAISGNTSAALSGNTTVKAINGLATFAGLSVNQTGTYSLTANSTPVYTAATSNLFSINGPTAKLAFATQPGGAAVGAALNPQPVVAIQDANGNLVSGDNSTMVTLAIKREHFGRIIR